MADVKSIANLKKLLEECSVSEVVNTHVLSNRPVCFGGKDELVFKLKKRLSDYFDVHLKSIEIVGSAKLGISLGASPNRYGRPYDDESDIDLVIVSNELFDVAWHELLKVEKDLYEKKELDLLKSSYENIHKGYISPNLLPVKMNFFKKWWEIFENLSNGDIFESRKIRGRLFKDWWFVEKYYSIKLSELTK